MNDTGHLVAAFAAGLLLGAAFFGGLWWTVRKCVTSPRPALWLLGSQLLRTSVVLAGFYIVAQGHWERLLTGLVGFIVARLVVLQVTRPAEFSTAQKTEVGHAPESR